MHTGRRERMHAATNAGVQGGPPAGKAEPETAAEKKRRSEGMSGSSGTKAVLLAVQPVHELNTCSLTQM